MLSLPENTVTPADRNVATGGKLWAPGAFVMIETPDFASVSAVRFAVSCWTSPSP
jgi:hypothetical protein